MNDTSTAVAERPKPHHSREIEVVTKDGEVVSGLPAGYESQGNQSLAVNLARAEIDQQIATAHALPRSITRAVQNIMTLATIDEESAEECIYALPRAGKVIKGPSIRLAEIISSQWGNCRVGARVVHVDRFEKYVEAEGVFHDLETNTATTARVRRRISDKKGKLLSEDMIVVTGNAACAIAKRNAILGGVPKAVWRKAYSAVEQVIAGDVKTLSERRDKAIKAFAAFGATPEQVFAALGLGGIDDITLEHLGTLTGMRSALKNGEATVEEMFPPRLANGDKPKSLGEALDRLANGDEEKEKETGATAQSTDAVKAGEEAAVGTPKAKEAPEIESSIAAIEAAKGRSLTEPEKKLLRRLHENLTNAMAPKTLERGASTFLSDHPLEEGSAAYQAAATIKKLNLDRVNGEAAIAEVDNAVKELLA